MDTLSNISEKPPELTTAPLHIVFLTPGFAENEQDSITIPSQQVLFKSIREALPDAKLSIIAFEYPFTGTSYEWFGIDVFPLNGGNKRWKKFIVWVKAFWLLKKLNKQQKIDVIHSFWIGECSFIGQYFSTLNQIKHIVTAMGQEAVKRNLYVAFLNQNSHLVSLSQTHSDLLFQKRGLIAQPILQDVDVSSFPELRSVTIDVLGAGSLSEVKNYGAFVDIIALAAQKKPEIRAAIAGDGPEYKNIKAKIHRLGLADNIILLGKMTRGEVLEKMAESKVFLHTSNHEAFGYVLAEALYSGLQLVSFNVGCATPSNRWQVGNSKEELAGMVLSALENQQEKLRVLLTEENTGLNTYLTLYYA